MIVKIYAEPTIEPMVYDGREPLGKQRSGIYQITCNPTGKVYIGSTVHIKKRKWEHQRRLTKQYHCNPHLQYAWDKYGKENFTFSVLEYCPNEKLVEREQFHIGRLKAASRIFGFNMSPVAGSQRGIKYGVEIRAKMSVAKMGNTNTLGHHLTNEHKAKITASLYGNTRSLGYKHTEESKKNMADSQLGRKHPLEVIEKIKDSNRGQTRSLVARERMSKAKTKFNVDQCEKIRDMYSDGGITYTAIAEMFNCSIATISRVCNNSRGPYI